MLDLAEYMVESCGRVTKLYLKVWGIDLLEENRRKQPGSGESPEGNLKSPPEEREERKWKRKRISALFIVDRFLGQLSCVTVESFQITRRDRQWRSRRSSRGAPSDVCSKEASEGFALKRFHRHL